MFSWFEARTRPGWLAGCWRTRNERVLCLSSPMIWRRFINRTIDDAQRRLQLSVSFSWFEARTRPGWLAGCWRTRNECVLLLAGVSDFGFFRQACDWWRSASTTIQHGLLASQDSNGIWIVRRFVMIVRRVRSLFLFAWVIRCSFINRVIMRFHSRSVLVDWLHKAKERFLTISMPGNICIRMVAILLFLPRTFYSCLWRSTEFGCTQSAQLFLIKYI